MCLLLAATALPASWDLGYTRNFCSEQHNKRTGYVCNSVHLVMREMMQGLEAGLVTRDTFSRLCGQLSSKLCCLPVCVLSWLISYFNFCQAPCTGLDKFLDMSLDTEVSVQEDVAGAGAVGG